MRNFLCNYVAAAQRPEMGKLCAVYFLWKKKIILFKWIVITSWNKLFYQQQYNEAFSTWIEELDILTPSWIIKIVINQLN